MLFAITVMAPMIATVCLNGVAHRRSIINSNVCLCTLSMTVDTVPGMSSWAQTPVESPVLSQTFMDRIDRFIAAKNITNTYTLSQGGQPTTTLGQLLLLLSWLS